MHLSITMHVTQCTNYENTSGFYLTL